MTNLTDLLSLIPRMMQNGFREGYRDGIIRAGLIAQGWKREDVDAAFAERAAQAQPEALAAHVPRQANIALTGQNTGADNG